MGGTAERLWEVIEPYVAREGIELDDIEVMGQGGASIVRVTIDAEEPVDVDRIARIARGVSRLLDDDDPLAGAYTLEVTSPGLERKLRRPRHYAKSLGREVKAKSHKPIDGERVHRGILSSAAAEEFTLQTENGAQSFLYSDIASARTVFVWGKAEPGNAEL